MTDPTAQGKGRRVYPDKDGLSLFQPGDYGKLKDGKWYCRPPGKEFHMGSLENHDVTEHEDGTITVSPSILIRYEGNEGGWEWHGYLEKGVWRKC